MNNDEPIKFNNLSGLKDILTIHIPQERSYDIISISLSKVIQEIQDFFYRYGLDASVLIIYKLIFEDKLSPLLSGYIGSIASFLIYKKLSIPYKEEPFVMEFPIKRALDRSLTLTWRVDEKRLYFKDYGTGLTIHTSSRLRIPLGALEACFIRILVDGLKAFNERKLLKDKPVLLVIDEFGIHCDPVLIQRILDLVFQTTFSINNLHTVVITHNPDILTRSLKLIEKQYSRERDVLDMVSIHQFLWDRASESVRIDTFGVKSVNEIITPAKKIMVFEESFEYINK